MAVPIVHPCICPQWAQRQSLHTESYVQVRLLQQPPTCLHQPAATPPQVDPGSKCADGSPSVGDFTFPGSFCCPAGYCISKVSSTATGLTTDVVPTCLKGGPIFAADNTTFLSYTNELCRRENDGMQVGGGAGGGVWGVCGGAADGLG